MGAFIKAKAPIKNRDELFTLGISGPLSGLIVAIIVTIIGLSMSFSVPESQTEIWEEEGFIGDLPWVILMFEILEYMAEKVGIIAVGSGETLLVHPVAFAGWVGFLITGLNLLPSGELGGGSCFSIYNRRRASQTSNHYLKPHTDIDRVMADGFARPILFRKGHPEGLDDVSPVSKRKKISAYLTMILAFICLPIPMYF